MPRPKRSYPLRAVCRGAGVSRKHAQALFDEIVEMASRGYGVSIPGLGKFWIQEYPARKIKIPQRPGSSSTRSISTGPSFALRFSSSEGLRRNLRIRSKGRAKGTW